MLNLVKGSAVSVKVYDPSGSPVKDLKLPLIFSMPIRKNLIRRAFLSSFTAKIQPQGRDPMAGKRTTAQSWGVGFGIARVPRTKGSRYPKANRAAFAPMTVGGRRTHPPTAEKVVYERINKKEKRLAVVSAISATADSKYVSLRGHRVSSIKQIPLVVTKDFEELSKSNEVRVSFKALGVWDDILRVSESKKLRAGKGKFRGRKYKIRRGPLLVLSGRVPVFDAAKNFLGVDIVDARNVSVIHLAPGGVPGRLTIWTEPSISILQERFKLG